MNERAIIPGAPSSARPVSSYVHSARRAINPLLLLFLFAIASFSATFTTSFQNFVPSETSSVFTSQNAQFGLFLEDIRSTSQTGGNVRATMFNHTTKTPLWKIEIYAPSANALTPDRILISNRGDFLLMTLGMDSQWYLYPKEGKPELLPRIHGPSDVWFEDHLAFIDDLKGTNVINVWLRDSDRWETALLPSLAPVEVTPDLTSRWNDHMRQKILDLIHRERLDNARRKLEPYSARLSELATNVAPVVRFHVLRNTHYEFLAMRRNPDDRSIFAEMLVPRVDSPPPDFPRNRPWQGSDWTVNSSVNPRSAEWAYRLYSYNERFIVGDPLLALFDQKISFTNIIYASLKEPLHYLGKATGKIQLPINLTKRSGLLRLSLIPDKFRGKTSPFAQIATIHDSSLIPLSPERFPPTNQITFIFETVHPGNYRLQAIWDKRAPFFDNPEHAGPGDYESDWSQPITITAGKTVSNLLLICTNRSTLPGGEAYYAADEAALQLKHQAK